MKIRTGFVSNSSSSSFVVVGKDIRCGDVMKNGEDLISKGRLYATPSDMYWDDGANFFPLTQEMFELYKKHGGALKFYDVQKICEEGIIKKSEIEGDEFNVFSMDISYHSIKTLEDFKGLIDIPDPPPSPEVEKIQEKIKQMEEEALRLKQELKEQGHPYEG